MGVDGIGGAFIFSNDPKRLAAWYAEHLGIRWEGEPPPFYAMFWGLDPDEPTRRMDTTLSIMKAKTPLPSHALPEEPDDMYGDQPFMVNFRTRDLEALVTSLEAKGVAILKREDFDYGRFAWVRDADGNRVELYQPLSA